MTQNILTYSILFPQFLFFILDLIVFGNSLKQGLNSKTEKTFFVFLLMISLLQLCTIITYAGDLGVISLPVWLQYVLTMLGTELIAVGCYVWVQYLILSGPGISILSKPFFQVLLFIPVIVELVACVTTPWTHLVFYMDESGVYQGGSSKLLQLLSYVYWFIAFIITVVRLIRGIKRANTLKRFILFLLPAALGGLINTTMFRGGYTQIGFSFAAVMLYLDQYVVEIMENKRLRSIDSLNRELITVNSELKAARDAADSANRAKTKFLFNMSHDIRTPMNAILGYTDIALTHPENEKKVTEYLGKIKHSGQHLLSLINDILEMSRIESDRLELTEAPVDIRSAIATISNMGHALALKKGVGFEVRKGTFANPYIRTDELHLNEVFLNLISNAVKYTPQGGLVIYTIRQEGKADKGRVNFRFDITDTGIGMSEEFQQHLFETFTRENDSTVSKEEGTGLGLSIVKNIVDLAGGTIEVKSKKNEGTSFTLNISFAVLEPEEIEVLERQAELNPSLEAEAVLSGKRILYAEDNEINREICEEILTEAGIVVESAENGLVAMHMVRDHDAGYYDAILMDIQMPVMNGYEATRAIRELPQGAEVPIIALSANAFAEDMAQSKEVGMNAHVPKPIDTGKLFETLRSLMN